MTADPRNCGICAIEFVPPKHNRPGLFCSVRCRNTNNARVSAARRGDMQRGTGRPDTYVKEGGKHQHRRAAETKLERALRKGEVVHHKDENKHNNHPDNLEVITQAEHMRRHGLGIPGQRPKGEPWRYRGTGENLSFTKLSDDAIRDIRRRVAAGEKQKDVGADYNIKQPYVSEIVRGTKRRYVD